jgi:hypothetical protein
MLNIFNSYEHYGMCTRLGAGGGRLDEGNNFDQKNNSPSRRVKLFLPVLSKNLMTDADDIIAKKK